MIVTQSKLAMRKAFAGGTFWYETSSVARIEQVLHPGRGMGKVSILWKSNFAERGYLEF